MTTNNGLPDNLLEVSTRFMLFQAALFHNIVKQFPRLHIILTLSLECKSVPKRSFSKYQQVYKQGTNLPVDNLAHKTIMSQREL